ncbi:MAG: Epoxide hydrolase, partial [uncultured Gemmatimonadetes bacterium]
DPPQHRLPPAHLCIGRDDVPVAPRAVAHADRARGRHPPLPRPGPRSGHRRAPPAHRRHALARPRDRARPDAGRADGEDTPARGVLGHGLRLAPGRGTAQRAAAVHDHHRRAGHPLHPRALQARRRDAAGDDARVARLRVRAAQDGRPAHRPHGARRAGGGRLPPRAAVHPRLRLLGKAHRRRLQPRGPHGPRVGRADEAPRLRALRVAGRRLGRAGGPGDGGAGAGGAARHPRQHARHRAARRAQAGAQRRARARHPARSREAGVRPAAILLQQGLRLCRHHEHPPADHQLQPDGFAGRDAGLLLRQVRGVDGQRRRAGAGPDVGRDARRRHALLADEHRCVFVAVLLGRGAGRGRSLRRRRHHESPGRGDDLPRRDIPRAAKLGRAVLPQAHLLERSRQGRPLRRVGRAGALLRRDACRVPLAAPTGV